MINEILSGKKIIYKNDTCFRNYFILDLNMYDIVCYNHVDNYKIKDGYITNIKTNEVYPFNDCTEYIDLDFNNINIDMISDIYSDFYKISVVRCDTIYNIDDKILLKNRCKRNYKIYIRLYTKCIIPEKFSIYYKAYIFNNKVLNEFK
jgi:hypothetical protein